MADNEIPTYAIPLVGYRSNKAAQMCAYFALKSGGEIEKLKLIKLIYLTEREFVRQHHIPMLFDELYSLPHGPICSSTLNGIDRVIDGDIWSNFIQMHGKSNAVAVKRFERDDFDEISDAEIAYLDATWGEFGRMTASQIRNWSHKHCPEYTEIDKGRVPISYADILKAFGDDAAEEVEREISELRRAESVLS